MSSGFSDGTAVILAGGLGTRLRSVIADRQKVVVEINGRPFLTYLLDQLVDSEVQRAVLCTGYFGEQVQEVLGNSYQGLVLDYSQETAPMGTGGALRLALPLIRSSQVLVMNGDSFCDIDLIEFRNFHERAKAIGSLVLVHVPNTERFGRVEVNSKSRLISFLEKGRTTGSGWINAGIYLLKTELIPEIDLDKPTSLELTMFPQWINRGLMGYQSAGRFLDIGTPQSYAAAADFFAADVHSPGLS